MITKMSLQGLFSTRKDNIRFKETETSLSTVGTDIQVMVPDCDTF